GLVLSKDIVELHGGQIRVESNAKGEEGHSYTSFTVDLPLGRDHLPEYTVFQSSGPTSIPSDARVDTYPSEALVVASSIPVDGEQRENGSEERSVVLLVDDNTDILT